MEHFIGRTPDKNRVFITITRKTQTVVVGHETAPRTIDVLSITGDEYSYRTKSHVGSGQIIMGLPAEDITPARGWTAEDIASLWSIWEKWHLNHVRSACEHMDLTGLPEDYDSRKHVACPETGEHYGSMWFAVEIPADVMAEIDRLDTLP